MVPYQRRVRCHIFSYCHIILYDAANYLYCLDVTTTQRPIIKQGIYSSVVYCIRSCIVFRFCIIGKCTLICLHVFISVQCSYTWSKAPNLTSAKVYIWILCYSQQKTFEHLGLSHCFKLSVNLHSRLIEICKTMAYITQCKLQTESDFERTSLVSYISYKKVIVLILLLYHC